MELLDIGAKRWLIVFAALFGLAFMYTMQDFDFVDFKQRHNQSFGATIEDGKEINFVVSRLIRFIVNDLLCIALIYALFNNRRYVLFGFYMQLFGLLVLFPIYIYLALNAQSYSNYSLLVPLYRLVMNPILMVLLIPAFYFQQFSQKNKTT